MLVGSDYLHTLNLVPCWLVSPRALLVRAGWKWLPACLETRVPGSCVLVPCWFVLVGSDYLHALKLVPAGWCLLVVRACWKWLPARLEPCACWLVSPCGSCLLEVITCMP